MMAYKGYTAKIEFDNDAGLFHGHVLHTRDVITFQGTSVDELRAAFGIRLMTTSSFARPWRGAGEALLGSLSRASGPSASSTGRHRRVAREGELEYVGHELLGARHEGSGRLDQVNEMKRRRPLVSG